MAYVARVANLLTEQLDSFAKLNRAALRVLLENPPCWMSEVRHCLSLLEGEPSRYKRFQLHTATGRVHASDTDVSRVRAALLTASFKFLKRCFTERLLDEATYRQNCAFVGHDIRVGIRYCVDCSGEIDANTKGDVCMACSPSGHFCNICHCPLDNGRFDAIKSNPVFGQYCKACSETRRPLIVAPPGWTGYDHTPKRRRAPDYYGELDLDHVQDLDVPPADRQATRHSRKNRGTQQGNVNQLIKCPECGTDLRPKNQARHRLKCPKRLRGK